EILQETPRYSLTHCCSIHLHQRFLLLHCTRQYIGLFH
ncbi:hypothetical protein M514_14275, partial [Trichuris suis]